VFDVGRHPFGDLLAEKAIALIGKHLRQAVKNGQDLEAREGMALGATLAGLAFSNLSVDAPFWLAGLLVLPAIFLALQARDRTAHANRVFSGGTPPSCA